MAQLNNSLPIGKIKEMIKYKSVIVLSKKKIDYKVLKE